MYSHKIKIVYIKNNTEDHFLLNNGDDNQFLMHLENLHRLSGVELKIQDYLRQAPVDLLVIELSAITQEIKDMLKPTEDGRKRRIDCAYVIVVDDGSDTASQSDMLHLTDEILTPDILSSKVAQKLADHIVERVKLSVILKNTHDVLKSSPDALLAMDGGGYITFVSPHYHERYPSSIEQLKPGIHILEAMESVAAESRMLDHFGTQQELRNWWENPVGAKEFKLANGVWLRLHARKMDHGGTVVTTMNVTDYKKQQAMLFAKSAQLSISHDKERQLMEQQRQFVSMVSHEFKTPLTIIDGNAQIIERRGDELTSEQRKIRAKNIRGSVTRLIELIDRILSIHTLETGKFDIHPDHIDFESLVQNLITEYQDYSVHHKINLEMRSLPKTVYVDPKIMRQVLSNLISNAIKYSPKSDRVDVSVVSNNGYLLIEVRDYGVGIPKEEVGRIFDRYFRASTSTGITGSGLGLSLVKDFIEMHQGSIVVESELSHGTVITVTLPILEEPKILTTH